MRILSHQGFVEASHSSSGSEVLPLKAKVWQASHVFLDCCPAF